MIFNSVFKSIRGLKEITDLLEPDKKKKLHSFLTEVKEINNSYYSKIDNNEDKLNKLFTVINKAKVREDWLTFGEGNSVLHRILVTFSDNTYPTFLTNKFINLISNTEFRIALGDYFDGLVPQNQYVFNPFLAVSEETYTKEHITINTLKSHIKKCNKNIDELLSALES